MSKIANICKLVYLSLSVYSVEDPDIKTHISFSIYFMFLQELCIHIIDFLLNVGELLYHNSNILYVLF